MTDVSAVAIRDGNGFSGGHGGRLSRFQWIGASRWACRHQRLDGGSVLEGSTRAQCRHDKWESDGCWRREDGWLRRNMEAPD